MSEPLKHVADTYAIEVTEKDGSKHFLISDTTEDVITGNWPSMCGTIGLKWRSKKRIVTHDGRTFTIVNVRRTIERTD